MAFNIFFKFLPSNKTSTVISPPDVTDMHLIPFFCFLALLLLLPPSTTAANIVLSNDDGWAEINVRALYGALRAAGEDVVLSAPARDESGTGKAYTILGKTT